jgi:hypothetical protein
MALNCHNYANLGARKQATLRRSRYGMRIYRDLRDLSGRELVSALHLERGGADLDPQTAGQRQEIGKHFAIVILRVEPSQGSASQIRDLPNKITPLPKHRPAFDCGAFSAACSH